MHAVHAHLQDVELAVLTLEAPGRGVGGEALAVRSQSIHVPIEDIAPEFPHGVIH